MVILIILHYEVTNKTSFDDWENNTSKTTTDIVNDNNNKLTGNNQVYIKSLIYGIKYIPLLIIIYPLWI